MAGLWYVYTHREAYAHATPRRARCLLSEHAESRESIFALGVSSLTPICRGARVFNPICTRARVSVCAQAQPASKITLLFYCAIIRLPRARGERGSSPVAHRAHYPPAPLVSDTRAINFPRLLVNFHLHVVSSGRLAGSLSSPFVYLNAFARVALPHADGSTDLSTFLTGGFVKSYRENMPTDSCFRLYTEKKNIVYFHIKVLYNIV